MGEEKGFKFVDKRKIFKEDEPSQTEEIFKSPSKDREDSSAHDKHKPEGPKSLPPVSFSTFIVSLSSSVLMHLGEIPDPTTGQYNKNLTLAKQTIDVLEMLKEKTKGNLDAEEEGLLANILFDLRVRYVKQVETEQKESKQIK